MKSKDEALSLANNGVRRFVLDIQIGSKPIGLDALDELKEFAPESQTYVYSRHVGRGVKTIPTVPCG